MASNPPGESSPTTPVTAPWVSPHADTWAARSQAALDDMGDFFSDATPSPSEPGTGAPTASQTEPTAPTTPDALTGAEGAAQGPAATDGSARPAPAGTATA